MKEDNKRQPLVSIIMPCYNTGQAVKRSIGSILNQSYNNIEIIAINDHSKDDTLQALTNIGETLKDSSYTLRIVNLVTNVGSGVARDEGLKIAYGKYIMFVDSDDWILPTTVSTCVAIMEKYNVDLVEFDYRRVSKYDQNDQELSTTLKEQIDDYEVITSNIEIERRSDHLMWNKIYRHEIITSNQLQFIHRVHQDTLFTRKYALLCKSAIFIKNNLYRYYFNTASVTSVKSQHRFENNQRGEEVIELYREYGLHKRIDEFVDASLNLLLRKLIPLSHQPHEDFRFVNPEGMVAKKSRKYIRLYNKNGMLFRLCSYFRIGLKSSFRIILKNGI